MLWLAGCSSGPQVSTTRPLVATADVPYSKLLVITLYSSFDSRRFLEDAIVERLRERGTDATASTSLMDTRTPVTRETFRAMVQDIGADAVLLTQLGGLQTTGTVVDMSPEGTRNFRPTWYFNVFSVETTEYVEPQAVNFQHDLVLLSDVYSVSRQEQVWGIQSASQIEMRFDRLRDLSLVYAEADAIVRELSRDGLIAR